MERKFKFSPGEFYHIYNRGNNKSLIFKNDEDKKRFQKLLYVCNSKNPVVFKSIKGLPLDKIERKETLVDIGAWCLMPNHFHLLLLEKEDGGISVFTSKLLTAYSMYFNKKYSRTGSLFEGAFRAVHADNDEYMKYLFSYIHLNPVKLFEPNWKEVGVLDLKLTKEYLLNYNYSSYLDYIGVKREEGIIINRSTFPEYFSGFDDFKKFIDNWLIFTSK